MAIPSFDAGLASGPVLVVLHGSTLATAC